MEKKLDKIEKLIENLAILTKRGFDSSGKRFLGLDQKSSKLEKNLLITNSRMEEGFLSLHRELKELRQEINFINSELIRLEEKIDLALQTEREDTESLFKDMEDLKVKVSELEKQLKFLKKSTT
jgi:seryl-tRNA synthetase